MQSNIHTTLDQVFSLYEKFGNADYIGEPVSQLEHMSQAAQLAIEEGADDEVILAAFFHDIGHICVMQNENNSMNGYGVKSHEKIGADFLRQKGFPERIAKLVENHVQAKRYLTFKDPAYYNSLSEASKHTLEFQGGVMTAEEAEGFENDVLFETSISLRRWDELAKETNVPLLNLGEIKSKALIVLSR
ncbi:phosphonate degradation HD-domain oxygenase [Chryseolinea sp. H1M3-3]|uniref:phosphonate degradation HD-domain oxygenase n=1 Tax=Chryseolinea sp. H1M3-3 TaxID=3034144 RepID=UPI0023EB9723|nr:phosphonate degradation HD-domain oxygenase [Chryseolinea sp. H1M3-3]